MRRMAASFTRVARFGVAARVRSSVRSVNSGETPGEILREELRALDIQVRGIVEVLGTHKAGLAIIDDSEVVLAALRLQLRHIIALVTRRLSRPVPHGRYDGDQ